LFLIVCGGSPLGSLKYRLRNFILIFKRNFWGFFVPPMGGQVILTAFGGWGLFIFLFALLCRAIFWGFFWAFVQLTFDF